MTFKFTHSVCHQISTWFKLEAVQSGVCIRSDIEHFYSIAEKFIECQVWGGDKQMSRTKAAVRTPKASKGGCRIQVGEKYRDDLALIAPD